MPAEPPVKRTIAFVDGQNLFHNARSVFGYTYPNYDVQKLAEAVCAPRRWKLERVQFYTGVPAPADNPFWHGFWSNKLAMMGRRGVVVYSRSLVYRNKTIQIPGFGLRTLHWWAMRKGSTFGSRSTRWTPHIETNSTWR
jgi:hypothetical protein